MTKKLDNYEQEIEENFESQESVLEEFNLQNLQKAAKVHLNSKKSITIRVSLRDIEAIKIKASKLGLAYQTYLNMLIHKEATKI